MSAVRSEATDPRTRILDAALALMSEQGSAGASMRQLAAACGLNVATIYHYFPSKADILRAVMDERRYGERLADEPPAIDASLPPRERLTDLLEWIWDNALLEEQVLRLLLGEAIRGEDEASSSVAVVVELVETTLGAWLADGFPEVHGDKAALGRVLSGQIFALAVEHLATGGLPRKVASARIGEIVQVLIP
ncbi:MAG TPA: TetR/AcrR family transcriptional regulator [Acidimicrobiales bacterium]|nr:TetR/AcrR family transcriptional regulator [Acidimicrobiales bacterium]